jgi:predicted ABC-class ATPase
MKGLERKLLAIDGRGYKAYKEIRGRYRGEGFTLIVDHVQGDPYAAPSRLRALVPWDVAAVPDHVRTGPARTRGARDFIARAFRLAIRGEPALSIDAGGQTVLERTACLFTDAGVELRFRLDLPADGRRVKGRQARDVLCNSLPRALLSSAVVGSLDRETLREHCDVVEDQTGLRAALSEAGLLAFVGDGSLLPRLCGIDDRPLGEGTRLSSPESLRVTLRAPNRGEVSGLGIRRGITLIVGGGFHGKTTLLKAIEQGVYDHVPGDGREWVVTDPTAVKVRAEDGRAVSGVDISPFIDNLPQGRATETFVTDLASGSTSQAAALVEAIEAGCRTVLLDEDTSATNFMIRDRRMQALVSKQAEPITPFVDRIRELRDRLGVSTVLVMGGSGDYFDHADTVIHMESYQPRDVTSRARAVAAEFPTARQEEHAADLEPPATRRLDPRSLRPERKPGQVKVQVRGRDDLVLGRTDIDLRAVEQVVDVSQLRAIGWLLARLCERGQSPLDPVRELQRDSCRLERGEWDWLTGCPDGDLALPRLQEAMAALSRLRGARFVGETRRVGLEPGQGQARLRK